MFCRVYLSSKDGGGLITMPRYLEFLGKVAVQYLIVLFKYRPECSLSAFVPSNRQERKGLKKPEGSTGNYQN